MPRKVLLMSHHHPDLVRGGGQQVCYELFEALQHTAWKPIFLASAQQATSPSVFKSGAAITGYNQREGEFLFLCQNYDHTWVSNREPISLEKFEMFLHHVAPEVIHFHHFIYFGMEFLTAARRYLDSVDGRLVFTLHEFLAICMANGQMVRTGDGSLCTQSSPLRCSECFAHFTPEFLSMRNMWIKHHFEMVDIFVSPSKFLRRVYEDWGLPSEKIVDIPYGLRSRRTGVELLHGGKPKRNRFAYFGQLIENKGLLILFDAIRVLRSKGVEDFTVDIHGANLQFASDEFRSAFEAFFVAERAQSQGEFQRVRLHKAYDVADLDRLMAAVDWVIIPSTWWENSPMVISEAFMFGKPVICSNIGGMAERVRHNVDGLHFSVGNASSLADTMARAMSEEGMWDRLHSKIVPPPTAADIAQQHVEQCYDHQKAVDQSRLQPRSPPRADQPTPSNTILQDLGS